MKKGNEGFSLVELIIVIAIMAVLVGLLAPQYMRFVKKSRINADFENAESIARAIDTAIAEQPVGSITGTITGTGGTDVSSYGISGVTELPASKVNSSYSWNIAIGSSGVTQIKLGNQVVYPSSTSAIASYH